MDPSKELLKASELREAGDTAEACRVIEAVVARFPDNIQALLDLIEIQIKTGALQAAKATADRLLTREPDHPEALRRKALAALKLGAHAEAATLCERAMGRDDAVDEKCWAILVKALENLGQTERLQATCRDYIATYPDSPRGYHSLGTALYTAGDYAGAEEAFLQGLAIDPDNAGLLSHLGNLYRVQGDAYRDLELQEKAAALEPATADVRNNLAVALFTVGQYDRALAEFEETQRLDPQSGSALVNIARYHLMHRNMEKGWAQWMWRHGTMKAYAECFKARLPFWDGSPLDGKRLYVWGEQGLGEQILFSSQLNELTARGIPYRMECEPRLVPLFRRSFPDGQFIPKQNLLPTIPNDRDLGAHISILDLVPYLYPSIQSMPQQPAFLRADPHLQRMFRERYGGNGPVVGISWRSGTPKNAFYKTSDLRDWAEILQLPGLTFVNLQYGDVADDLAAVADELGVTIINDPEVDSARSMDTFAAQVAAMDLVISTSNTTVHVAGGLGVPTWMMTSHGSGLLWYWFVDGDSAIWYPDVQIFRKHFDAPWSALLDLLYLKLATEKAALTDRARARGTGQVATEEAAPRDRGQEHPNASAPTPFQNAS